MLVNKNIRKYYKGQDIFNLPLYDKETYLKLELMGEQPRKLLYFKNDKGKVFGVLAKYKNKDNDMVEVDLNGSSSSIPFSWIIGFKEWSVTRMVCSKCQIPKHPDEFNVRMNKSGLLKHTIVCIYCNHEKRSKERDNNDFKYVRKEK